MPEQPGTVHFAQECSLCEVLMKRRKGGAKDLVLSALLRKQLERETSMGQQGISTIQGWRHPDQQSLLKCTKRCIFLATTLSSLGFFGSLQPVHSQPLEPVHSKPEDPVTAQVGGPIKKFRFVAFGDYQGGISAYPVDGTDAIMKNLDKQAGLPVPSFYVNTGDIATFAAFKQFPHGKNSLYPARGNNDSDSFWSSIYPLPAPVKNKYSVTLNNSRFIFLDTTPSNWETLFPPKSKTLNCKVSPTTQTDWLACELKQANDSAAIDNIFVVMHKPPLTYDGPYPKNDKALAVLGPIFEKQPKLRAVLSGHNHFYQRMRRNGVNYMVIGGGGAGLYAFAGDSSDEVKKRASLHHFAVFDVDGSRVNLKVIGYDNTLHKFIPLPLDVVSLSCNSGQTLKMPCPFGIRIDACVNGSWVPGKCLKIPCPAGICP